MGFNHFAEIGAALLIELEATQQTLANDAVTNIKAHIEANGQVDTGTMLNSVHTEAADDGVQVVVGVDYGAYQNYGTRYLPPRPFFEPGLADTQQNADSILAEAVRTVLGA